jgi:cyclohexanecarboxylate-CoA ligase
VARPDVRGRPAPLGAGATRQARRGRPLPARRPADRLLSYAELARLVDRFAGGPLELGVRRGDVVAVDLLNTWEEPVLILACARLGAVVSPVVVFTGPRELRQVLERTAVRVCVVLERFGDRPLAAELAGMRRELPTLEHPAVLGDAATGALDLVGHFLETPWEEKHPAEELTPRRPPPTTCSSCCTPRAPPASPRA